MTLSTRKIEMLRGSYDRGMSQREAAEQVDVAGATVGRYFKKFDRERGVARAPRVKRKRAPLDPPPPRYHGPLQVGKPIGAPPVRFGPDWIGKACPPRGR